MCMYIGQRHKKLSINPLLHSMNGFQYDVTLKVLWHLSIYMIHASLTFKYQTFQRPEPKYHNELLFHIVYVGLLKLPCP